MDDLIGIVVLVLYLVAAFVGKKNKKKKKEQRQAAKARPMQFEQAFERMTSTQRERFERSVGKADDKPRPAVRDEDEGQDPCHDDMLGEERPAMRLQNVSQTQLKMAEEGEDPCHTGEAPHGFDEGAESPVMRSPIFDTEDADAFARDVLRGVIMSEVLDRPARRRYGPGMKRGA